jgi:hypothetical protein
MNGMIEQKWTVSSVETEDRKNDDWSRLAGLWSSQLRVSVSKPFEIRQGPVANHFVIVHAEKDGLVPVGGS